MHGRQILDLQINGVPLFDFVGQRDTLIQWADRKGEEGVMTPWKERNQWSVDDKPTGLLSE